MDQRPKRTLLAYCALADRLETAGANSVKALVPFLAEVCAGFAGEMFDARKLSEAVSSRYGLSIPRLAILGMAEQLASEGLLLEISSGTTSAVYRYAPTAQLTAAATVSSVTEAQVTNLLQRFIDYCKADPALSEVEEPELEEDFLQRLLNTESMRILTRKEGQISTKRTVDTIILKNKEEGKDEGALELHKDFVVSQFLLDLRDADESAFEKASDIAFAAMAAEAKHALESLQMAGR